MAGLITSNVAFGFAGLKRLSMNSPYSRSIRTWSVDSGAAAYSHGTPRAAMPHEAGAGFVSGFLVIAIRPGLWTDYATLTPSRWSRNRLWSRPPV